MLEVFIFYLIGTIIGYASGVFKKLPNKSKTSGIITTLKQKQSNEGFYRPTYTAVAEYTVYNKEYTIESSYQSNTFRKGQSVTVCFDSENPQDSFIRAGVSLYIVTYTCYFVGSILLIKLILTGIGLY